MPAAGRFGAVLCAMATPFGPDGRLDLDWSGGSDVLWDTQTTMRGRNDARVFLDDHGRQVLESGLALRLEDGRVVIPALRFVPPGEGA